MELNQKSSVTDLQQNLQGRPYLRPEVLKNSITNSWYLAKSALSPLEAEGKGDPEAQELGSQL